MAQMVNIPTSNTDPQYRYKMPRLIAKTEGRGNGIKTSVMNCKEIAAAVHRPPDYLMKWWGYELCAKASYTDKEGEGVRALVTGSHQMADLQQSLDKFLATYVLCPVCGLPEMNLKIKKKEEKINGECNACGFNDYLKDATCHKMAGYVLKNPPEGEKLTGSAKKDKKQKDAKKGDDEGDKKKKKKNRHADEEEEEEDLDDEKAEKKKKKKEKKEKKSKKKGGDGSDGEGDPVAKKDKGSSSEEETLGHKDEDVINMIGNLKEMKDAEVKAFVEESRLQMLSAQLDRKMLVYIVLEALFPDGELNKDNVLLDPAKSKLLGVIDNEDGKIGIRDMMWGFELYVSEHGDCLKGFPHVCKSLYDLEVIDEDNFVPYFDDKMANAGNPGHDSVHKVIAPFVKWLRESSDSDSDSD